MGRVQTTPSMYTCLMIEYPEPMGILIGSPFSKVPRPAAAAVCSGFQVLVGSGV